MHLLNNKDEGEIEEVPEIDESESPGLYDQEKVNTKISFENKAYCKLFNCIFV